MNMQKDLFGVANVLKMNPSSLPKTVIFCSKKETVSSVYRFLHCSDKSSVTMYHASLTEQTKKAVYDELHHIFGASYQLIWGNGMYGCTYHACLSCNYC